MPRVKLFKEEEVLKKAMEVFWQKGYYATSMQDLVDGMGINRASLYDTFGGKEALFEQAFKQYRETSKKRIADFLRSHPSVREGLLTLYEQTIDNAVADPDAKGCFVVNTTTGLAPGDRAMYDTLAKNKAELEQLFLDYLHLGAANGEIPKDKDLPTIAAFLFTLYNGVMVLTKIEPDKNKLMASVRAGLVVLD